MAKIIILTKGKSVVVDDEDFDILNNFKWCYSHGYALRDDGKARIYMHRQIMDYPENLEVDHINRNTLDNTRKNLRVCTHAQNLLNQKMKSTNKSGYKGIFKVGNKWRAQIKTNNKIIDLGYFSTPEKAHAKYLDEYQKLILLPL